MSTEADQDRKYVRKILKNDHETKDSKDHMRQSL